MYDTFSILLHSIQCEVSLILVHVQDRRQHHQDQIMSSNLTIKGIKGEKDQILHNHMYKTETKG